jgi:hypothetical protein
MRPYSKTVYPTGPIPQVVPSVFTTAPPPRDTESPGISLILGDRLPPTEPVLYDIPLTSAMVKQESATATRLTCAQRDQWAGDNLPSRIQVALATPFGKDLSLHTFGLICRSQRLSIGTDLLDQAESLISASRKFCSCYWWSIQSQD